MNEIIKKIIGIKFVTKNEDNPVRVFYAKTSAAEKKKVYINALRAAQEDQLAILNRKPQPTHG